MSGASHPYRAIRETPRVDMGRAVAIAADAALGWLPLPVASRDVSRLAAWACFAAAAARLGGAVAPAFALLVASLVFDMIDGVDARRRGEHRPHVDRATDRFSESLLVGMLLLRDPLPVALAYTVAYAANVFLPIGHLPVLPLRWALVAYLAILLLRPDLVGALS